jgi:hypothetical protein
MSIITRDCMTGAVTVQPAGHGAPGMPTYIDPVTGIAYVLPGAPPAYIPYAATAGAFMANTYVLQAPHGPAPDPFVTTNTFGPLTNADVVAVGAVPGGYGAAEPLPPRVAYARSLPWPVPETAVGYIAQQDLARW